jgi:signal transduction histidine kinase
MPDGRSVTTCEDITEAIDRERTSAELARNAALADAANMAKSAFLSNMSHEFKTPLNAIIGFSEIMFGEHLGPLGSMTYRTYAKDIFDSGSNLLQILDQALHMALLDDGGVLLDEGTFDLAALLRETIAGFETRAREKRLAMRFIDAEHPVHFIGDKAKLGLVLESIIENAVKFCLPHGAVVISMKFSGEGWLQINVSDTGEGIPEDKVEAILTAFGQVESEYSRKHHGAGLGLPIADGLVRLHDGTISIDSSLDIGTTVRISFPRERLAPQSRLAMPEVSAQKRAGKR